MMKKSCRFISLCLLAALLAGCGETASTTDTKAADTTASEPEEESLFVKDDLPEGLDLGGESVRFCVMSNRMGQYYVEEADGDVVNDAIFTARRNVEDRLNVKLEYLPYSYTSWDDRTTYMNQVGASILADSDDFDVVGSTSFMAQFFVAGYLSNLKGRPYLDFEKPYWSSYMAENITVDGVLPFMTGDISIGGIKSMMCMFYNKDLHEMYGLDDLYEIVENGDWTVDKLEEMMKTAYVDLNGDTKVDEEDRLGLVLEGSNYATGFFDACEMQIYDTTGGKFTFIFDDQHNTDVVQRLVKLLHENDSAMIRGRDDNANYLAEESLFRNGNVLFTGGWISCAESYRDLSFDWGLLPYPKFDENQKDYRTTVLNTYTSFGLPVTCKRIEASCASLEALASEFYRTVTPAYFEVALKVKYSRDDQSSRMFDRIRANSGFSFGMVFTNAIDLIDTKFKDALNKNDPNWASTMASVKDNAVRKTEDLVKAFEDAGK